MSVNESERPAPELAWHGEVGEIEVPMVARGGGPIVSPDCLAEDREETTYERARNVVTMAHASITEQLVAKRAHRDRLNDEIRQLVAEEDLLRRMERIARGGNGDRSPEA